MCALEHVVVGDQGEEEEAREEEAGETQIQVERVSPLVRVALGLLRGLDCDEEYRYILPSIGGGRARPRPSQKQWHLFIRDLKKQIGFKLFT